MDNIITKDGREMPHPNDVTVPVELSLTEIGFLANAVAYLFAKASGNPAADMTFGAPLAVAMGLLGAAACADLNHRLGEVLSAQASEYGTIEKVAANGQGADEIAAQAFAPSTGGMVS